MKYYVDSQLSIFEFWGGAQDNAARLTAEELDKIGDELESNDFWAEGMPDAGQVNDLFWFDFDFVLSLIGLSEEDLDERDADS